MRRKQAVFVHEDKEDHFLLTNGSLISKEDVDLLYHIYAPLDKNGYVRMKGKLDEWRQHAFIHTIIAKRMGLDPALTIDHINNVKDDNRRENLQAISGRNNSTKDRKGSSKYYRVSWYTSRNKWRVYFSIRDSRPEFFGYYNDEVEAAYWADVFAVRFLPEDTLLNFPDNINLYFEEALLNPSTYPWQREIPTLEKLYAKETL